MKLSEDAVKSLLNQPLKDLSEIRLSDELEGEGFRKTTPAEKRTQAKKLGYVKIPGQINLSYSKNQSIYSCPRKFQLRELLDQTMERESNIHFAFGSAFGAGVQEYFLSQSLSRAFTAAFANWSIDINETQKRSNKSLGTVMHGIQVVAQHIYPQIVSRGYELAYFKGKPCIELFFLIDIKGRYNYQGHIDLVLFSPETKKFTILELKTASQVQHEANWKESSQALGYSVLMDAIARDYGYTLSYEVEYLIYNPSHNLMCEEMDWGFTNYTFKKSPEAKAEFVLTLMLEVKLLEMYLEHDFFPKRGEHCVNFGRACEFFGSCDQLVRDRGISETESAYETKELEEVDYVISMDRLLEVQEEDEQGQEEVEQPNVTVTPAIRNMLDGEN